MGLVKMLLDKKSVKENDLKEYVIEVPTMVLCLTKDELANFESVDAYSYILEKSKYIKDMTLVLDPEKIYLFVTHQDRHLKCVIGINGYLGNIGKLNTDLLDDKTQGCLNKLIMSSFVVLSTGKVGDPTGELNEITKDLMSLKSKIDIVMSNEVVLPANTRIIKYDYKHLDGRMVVELTEDYVIRNSRELPIKIGEVYVFDCVDGYKIYGGTNAGTVTTLVQDIDINGRSILCRELIKARLGE